jgi:phospholipid/cholesterol/gamma-HCH transport system substrate-binding protein
MFKYSTEFKVGLFTLICIAVLIITAFILGGNPFTGRSQDFYTVLDNAGGVAQRTQIRVSGVKVGTVSQVDILPKGARVELKIDGSVKVPTGSHIEIVSRGVLGDVYMEIVRNESGVGYLKSGDYLPFNTDGNNVQSLVKSLNSITRDIKQVSNTLANVLGTKEGETSLKNIVANIEGMTKDLREITSTQKGNVKEAIQAIRDSSVRIAGLLEKNDTKINQIIGDLHQFTGELRQLSTPENRKKVEAIIANVDQSSASLKKMLSKIEKGEGTIGQLVAKDETAEEVKATLRDIQKVVRPLASLKIMITDRAEYRFANAANNDQISNEFDFIISTRPDRYYLLGVTNSAYARNVTNTVVTTNTSGNTTTTNTQQNTPEDVGYWRFNAQISQRMGFIALRLGLFENTAGIATDVFAFDDKLIGSIELSQFGGAPIQSDTTYGSRGPVSIKAYADLYLTPHMFLTAGVDNMVLYTHPFPFIGGGFAITDEEIKGLFGVAALSK